MFAGEEVVTVRVAEIMLTNPQYVLTGQTVEHAAKRIMNHGLSLLPVCRSDRTVMGVITPREIVKAVAQSRAPELCPVDDVMVGEFAACSVDDPTDEIYARMITTSQSEMIVQQQGKLAGMVDRVCLSAASLRPARVRSRRVV